MDTNNHIFLPHSLLRIWTRSSRCCRWICRGVYECALRRLCTANHCDLIHLAIRAPALGQAPDSLMGSHPTDSHPFFLYLVAWYGASNESCEMLHAFISPGFSQNKYLSRRSETKVLLGQNLYRVSRSDYRHFSPNFFSRLAQYCYIGQFLYIEVRVFICWFSYSATYAKQPTMWWTFSITDNILFQNIFHTQIFPPFIYISQTGFQYLNAPNVLMIQHGGFLLFSPHSKVNMFHEGTTIWIVFSFCFERYWLLFLRIASSTARWNFKRVWNLTFKSIFIFVK